MFDYESDSDNEEDPLELEVPSESINCDPLGNEKDKIGIGPLQVYCILCYCMYLLNSFQVCCLYF